MSGCRDARITTIYEGPANCRSLRQCAAYRAERAKYLSELAQAPYADSVQDLLALLKRYGTDGQSGGLCERVGRDYMDLYGRQLVDSAIALINRYLFCGQPPARLDGNAGCPNGQSDQPKTIPMALQEMIARGYYARNAEKIRALTAEICSGDRSTFKEYEILAGPAPELS